MGPLGRPAARACGRSWPLAGALGRDVEGASLKQAAATPCCRSAGQSARLGRKGAFWAILSPKLDTARGPPSWRAVELLASGGGTSRPPLSWPLPRPQTGEQAATSSPLQPSGSAATGEQANRSPGCADTPLGPLDSVWLAGARKL